MIYYENDKWTAFFSLKGSVLQKAFKWSVLYMTLSVIFSYFIRNWKSISGSEWIEVQKLQEMDFGSRLRDFTFVLGFFISFTAQKAYSRWWEGGTLLQQLRGEWFNAFSSLLAFSNPDPKIRPQVDDFQRKLASMVSLLYAMALSQVSTTQRTFEFLNISGFEVESLEFMSDAPDGCEVVLQWMQRAIVEANGQDIIKIAPPILSRVYNQLGNGIVRLNNARKIREFPIPFPIAQVVWFQLIFHGLLTSFTCAVLVDSYTLVIIFTFLVCQSLWTIHYITLELEQPFGDDANDLPLEDMMFDLNNSLSYLLKPKALQPPACKCVLNSAGDLPREVIDLEACIEALQEDKADKAGIPRVAKTPTKKNRQSRFANFAEGNVGHSKNGAKTFARNQAMDSNYEDEDPAVLAFSNLGDAGAGGATEGYSTEGSALDKDYRDHIQRPKQIAGEDSIIPASSTDISPGNSATVDTSPDGQRSPGVGGGEQQETLTSDQSVASQRTALKREVRVEVDERSGNLRVLALSSEQRENQGQSVASEARALGNYPGVAAEPTASRSELAQYNDYSSV